jgi:hypothetical protein
MENNPELAIKLFDKSNGFDDAKNDAIQLLDKFIKILDFYNIDHFLISGTLLGQQRHNDFIPWDDDIDILVSNDFINKYDLIMEEIKLTNEYLLHTYEDKYFYKFCFKDKIISHGSYCWPFIDVFTFDLSETKLHFFKKEWAYDKFFPIKKTIFNNILVSIPHDPVYFLSINYGLDYMCHFKSSTWNHKKEHGIKNISSFIVDEQNI